MSVLGRRLAGAEGAYFLQESKNAAGRLAAAQQKKAAASSKGELKSLPRAAGVAVGKQQPVAAESADVLPEILRHSIPLRCQDEMSPSSFSGGSKWNLGNDPASSSRLDGVINPLRDYVSLPQVTFGPKRWQLPDAQNSVLASTANDLRRDRYPQPINPERLKDAAAGLSQIGKAFAIATAIIFGGVTSIVAFTASKLEIQNTDDIRMKGRDMIQPRAELIREQMAPLRTWAEKLSRKWHSSGENEANGNPIVQQLLKVTPLRKEKKTRKRKRSTSPPSPTSEASCT